MAEGDVTPGTLYPVWGNIRRLFKLRGCYVPPAQHSVSNEHLRPPLCPRWPGCQKLVYMLCLPHCYLSAEHSSAFIPILTVALFSAVFLHSYSSWHTCWLVGTKLFVLITYYIYCVQFTRTDDVL